METPVQIAISTSFDRRLTEGSRGEASDIDMQAEGRVSRGERVKRHTRSVSIRVIHRPSTAFRARLLITEPFP